jgi:hypothetical protein
MALFLDTHDRAHKTFPPPQIGLPYDSITEMAMGPRRRL